MIRPTPLRHPPQFATLRLVTRASLLVFPCGVALCALFATGCGRASADPARFSGRFGTGRIDPSLVREVKNKPSGSATLGHVTARCRVDEGVRAMRDVALADVDCSEDLLSAALREKAAFVGGQMLVGRTCAHDEQSPGDAWKSTLVSCSATVVTGAGAASSAEAADMPSPIALEYESPEQAFRVTVSFAPTDATRQYAPRPPDRVNELAVVPPSHIVTGDIAAHCRGECDRAAVRYAVRAAAGRAGATDVAGIACIRSKHGFLCTGHAARPEADPETNLLAR